MKGFKWKWFHININTDISKTVFLAGSGRGGTTWLAELLNFRNNYRYMFEPFSSSHVRICEQFNTRQYLRENSKNKEYYNVTRLILSGAIHHKWIDRFNKKFICKERLIKDIRVNLFLKWMNVNFPSMPIILMLRHPCAVALSRITLNWGTHLDEIITQKDLVNDFLSKHIKNIKNCTNKFEQNIYLWCIENYVPLKQFRKGEIHIVFYENLCINTEKELKCIFKWLNIPFTYDILEKVSVPSKMSEENSAVVTGENLVEKWKNQLNNKQISSAVNILCDFGLNQIYDSQPMPKVEDPLSVFSNDG